MEITEVYQKYRNSVYRLAVTYLKSAGDAEDICHDVFIRYVRNKDRVREGSEQAWLLKVTANMCRDVLRSYKRHRTEPLDEELPAPGDDLSYVLDAVMSLPVRERTAVYLYYYEGRCTDEIARITGTTRTSVTTRLSRARKKLKDILEDCHD